MSKSSEAIKKWRKVAKTVIIECLGGSCQICFYNKSITALETHHVNSDEKDFTLSYILSSCRSWDILYKEAAKCILLCANCHREVHENITQIPKSYSKFDTNKADSIRSLMSARKIGKKRTTVDENIIKFNGSKKRQQQRNRESSKRSIIDNRIDLILNSNIDFTSYGWVTDISKIIQISPQKVTPWMKRHMLEFYNERCFIRR